MNTIDYEKDKEIARLKSLVNPIHLESFKDFDQTNIKGEYDECDGKEIFEIFSSKDHFSTSSTAKEFTDRFEITIYASDVDYVTEYLERVIPNFNAIKDLLLLDYDEYINSHDDTDCLLYRLTSGKIVCLEDSYGN